MRKILFTLILSTTLISLTKGATKITGKLTNSDDLSYIYLYESLGTEAQKIDSAAIKKGAFSFKSNLSRGYYRIGFNPQNNFTFILSNEELLIEADAKDLAKTTKISNSIENEKLALFNNFNQGYSLQKYPDRNPLLVYLRLYHFVQ